MTLNALVAMVVNIVKITLNPQKLNVENVYVEFAQEVLAKKLNSTRK